MTGAAFAEPGRRWLMSRTRRTTDPAGQSRLRHQLIGLLAAFALVAGGLGLVTIPASADERPVIEVELSSLEPARPDRDGEVTLTGTIRNTSDLPIANVRPYLWRNQAPLSNRVALDPVLAGELPAGSRVWTDGAFQNLTDGRGAMQPDEELPFSVSAKIEDLDLPRSPGVYPIGIDVLGQVDGGPNSVPGSTRTLLPLPSEDSETPERTRITSVVMLTAEPSMYAPGRFIDDDLAAEVSRDGRLSTLLSAAGEPGMSWAIDPSLHDELTAMANGYRYRDASGQLREGVGTDAAARWLSDFANLEQSTGFRLPYALIDAPAAAAQDMPQLVERAARLGAESQLSALPVLQWSGDGVTTDAVIEAGSVLAPRAVLAANPDSPYRLLQPPAGSDADVVNYDPLAYGGGPEGDSPTHQRQRLLAESLVDASTQPEGGGTVRVITTQAEATADAAAAAPWVRRFPLNDLLATDPQEWTGAYIDTPQQVLNPEQLALVDSIERRSAAYVGAQADPEQSAAAITALLARAASTSWRGRAAEQETFVRPIDETLTSFFDGSAVRLESTERVTMDDRQGRFPVTVTSELSDPVEVLVAFDSDNESRLSIPRTDLIEVPGGDAVSVDVFPRAVGNGTVPVTGQLITPDGTPVGDPVTIEVQATRLGAVGWVIVAISGAVLVVSTLLRIRQVRRNRPDNEPALSDDVSGDVP